MWELILFEPAEQIRTKLKPVLVSSYISSSLTRWPLQHNFILSSQPIRSLSARDFLSQNVTLSKISENDAAVKLQRASLSVRCMHVNATIW